jgi:hypothetical protein
MNFWPGKNKSHRRVRGEKRNAGKTFTAKGATPAKGAGAGDAKKSEREEVKTK